MQFFPREPDLRAAAFLPALLLCVAGALCASRAESDEPATRPIRFIVPFTPGTGMDNIARRVGEQMLTRLGQPVVVENRTGVAGMLGAEMVARAPADGHTLLVSASNLTITATLYASTGFNPMTELAPMTIAAYGNATLVVSGKSDISTLAELIARAKEHPGVLTFASPGVGSPQHIALEQLQAITGTSFVHVPYKGNGPAVADLIAGHVDAMFVATHTVMPYVNAGQLKALGVGAQQRHKAAPQIPSFAELGIKGFKTDAWYGFLAPKDTPPALLGKLTDEIKSILLLPEVKSSLEKTGLDVRPSTPEEMRAVMEREYAEFGDIIRRNHITAQ